jgi:hypothetical protein
MDSIRLFHTRLVCPNICSFAGAHGSSAIVRRADRHFLEIAWEEYAITARLPKSVFHSLTALAMREDKELADLLEEGIKRVVASRYPKERPSKHVGSEVAITTPS